MSRNIVYTDPDWDNVVVADQESVLAEVGSCDIFDLLMSEIQPPPSLEAQVMKQQEATPCDSQEPTSQHQLSTQTKLLREGISSAEKNRSDLQGGDHQRNKRPLKLAHEPRSIEQKRRRIKLNQKIQALQELLPDCTKKDTSSVLEGAIKRIQLLKNQAECLKLQYMMPMAPAFFAAPTVFYQSMLPSSGLQMVAPPPPHQLPRQLAGVSSNQREDGAEGS